MFRDAVVFSLISLIFINFLYFFIIIFRSHKADEMTVSFLDDVSRYLSEFMVGIYFALLLVPEG